MTGSAKRDAGNNLFWRARGRMAGWVWPPGGGAVQGWIGTFVRGQEAIDCNSDTSAETRLLIILLSGSSLIHRGRDFGHMQAAAARLRARDPSERPPPPTPPMAERKKRKFCPQLLHSQTAPRAEQKFAPGMVLPPSLLAAPLHHCCGSRPNEGERERVILLHRWAKTGAFSFKV